MDGSRIEIEPRFNGPAGSGQGGYSCGVFAALVPGPAEVTLRRPVPLGRPLDIDRIGSAAVAIKDGGVLIAEAKSAPLEITVPPPVRLQEAKRASRAYRSGKEIFARCFVCGPDREDSQGVFAGEVAGKKIVASPWTPGGEWLAEGGLVRPEFVWAVLDCPTYFALEIERPGLLAMLGQMTVRLIEPVPVGEPHIVIAWPIGSARRKHEAGCAVFSEDGRLRAAARAVQIEVGGVPGPAGAG